MKEIGDDFVSAVPTEAPKTALLVAPCDECVDYEGDDEATCPECEGDGGDKWNDYCLPCPMCGGDGRLW